MITNRRFRRVPIALGLSLALLSSSPAFAATPAATSATSPAQPPSAHDALVARLRALASHAGDFGPVYAPLYRAALPWYEAFGGNPPHAVDAGMVSPEQYASELADSLAAGKNYFADNPRALFPLVFDGRPVTGRSGRTNYWLILPAGFGEPGRTFPLIISLHGSGWLGHKISFVRAARKPISAGRAFEVTPINEGGPWQVDYLNAYLDELQCILPIDADRVYLQGHSLGAIGTWAWALQNPERFAAICPQAGIGQPFRAARLVDVPAWVVHGEQDDVIPSGFSDQMVSALQDCGGRVRYSRLPDVGHNMPADLNSLRIGEWYLRQSRRHTPPPPDPLASLGLGPDGCSRWEIVEHAGGQFWHSEPVDLADREATLAVARALFRQANSHGELVDSPLIFRNERDTKLTTAWLEQPKTLRRDRIADDRLVTIPAGRFVRFYFRGTTPDGLQRATAIGNEVAARGEKLAGQVWITLLTVSSQPESFLSEYRIALQ